MKNKAQAARIIARHQKMKSMRSQWETHWQECADYVIPRKNDINRTSTAGSKKNLHLYDSTATQAAELLAGALHGMLTNPTSLFFGLTTADDKLNRNDVARLWLDQATRKMHNVLNNSNFQTEVHELYTDLTWAGTAGMLIEEDEDESDDSQIIRFSSRHIAELFVEENNKGRIDTVYRVYKWKARQVLLEFGEENVPEVIKKMAVQDPSRDFEIIHACEPRDKKLTKGKGGPLSWPFASTFVLVEEGCVLREGGFREFPYAVPRWTKDSGETYGRSPAMNCLPDVKMINEMMKTTIRAAQKTVDPPLQAPDDGFIGPIRTTPAGMNYYRAGTTDRIEAFGNEGRVDFGIQMLADVRSRIRSAFYVDQLQLQQGPQMTATEVMQRTEEKLRLMGPMLGRQHNEFLNPTLTRVFNIMLRRGLLGQIPQVLSGAKVEFQYTSAIAKAQKMSEGQSIMRTVQTIAPFVQADPTIMDNFDGDEAARFIADIYGMPATLLRKQKDRDGIREGRAKAAQEERKAMMDRHMAETAGKAVPAVEALAAANSGGAQ